jgi:hypothetical protein
MHESSMIYFTGTLSLPQGRWRENLTQTTTRECWDKNACSGGVADIRLTNVSSATDSYCAAAYKAPCTVTTVHAYLI